MKIRGGRGKMVLRDLLYRHVPPALIERPKAGFAIPLGEWLRGPLRPWAEELLDRGLDDYFDAQAVRRRWRDHLSREREGASSIWSVLMFQAWRSAQV
jgi:asparagine synthase (glutamine-hydrolysing)